MVKTTLLYIFILIGASGFSQTNNPEYDSFKNGSYKKFVSDGSGNSSGFKFSFKYPTVWKEKEADRPNIAAKVLGDNLACMVEIHKYEESFTEEEKQYCYDGSLVMELFNVSKLTSNDPNQKIDGERAGCAEFTIIQERLDQKLELKALMYTVVYKDYLVILSFITSIGPNDKMSSQAKYDNYKPLFRSIANSFVLLSKWN